MSLDSISLILLLLINIFLSVRFYTQNKQWNFVSFSVCLNHVCVTCIGVAQVLVFTDQLNLNHLSLALSGLIPLLFGVLTVIVSFIAIKDLTSKKLTTIWKTPILALLAGFFLEIKFVEWLCLGFFGISFYILLKEKTKLRYPLKHLLGVLPVLIGLFLFSLDRLWILNISLIWYVLSTNVFNNLVIASNLFSIHGSPVED